MIILYRCPSHSIYFECSKMKSNTLLVSAVLYLLLTEEAICLNKRCVRCRSRGELGTCGDPFPFNVTEPEAEAGIHVMACPSGWCAKMIEGTTGTFRTDDYGAATERMCLQRPPNDYEERCAYTMWNHRKVYMCFCNGDLCNAAVNISTFSPLILLTVLMTIYNMF